LSFTSIRLSLNEKNKRTASTGNCTSKRKGKFKGGKPKFSENDPRLQLAFKLYLEGATEKDVERQTGINRGHFKDTEKVQYS
jgi:hypothetical protein